jgi:putative tryptophan/tyrosine transport system substrate-binding protein
LERSSDGLSDRSRADAIGKSVELLHTVVPSAERIAILMSANPIHPQTYGLVDAAAKGSGLATVRAVVPAPGAALKMKK